MAQRTYASFDVYEAAKRRIHWCYDNFDAVTVAWSGGKDSTAMMGVALEVARERGELPLLVYWLDCEAEYQAVADLAERLYHSPDIDFRWYQIPMTLFDASAATEFKYLKAWDPDMKHVWMRPQVPYSIKENVYGTTIFGELPAKFLEMDLLPDPEKRAANLVGLRANESATRAQTMWGSHHNLHCNLTAFGMTLPPFGHALDYYDLYGWPVFPIYDWNYSDVWKAIHANGWDYVDIYDKMYSLGISVDNMRVSSLIHENAFSSQSSRLLAEIEPETWERLIVRCESMNDVRHVERDQVYHIKDLPPAYRNWREYRDDLLERLHGDKPEVRDKHMPRIFGHQDRLMDEFEMPRKERTKVYQQQLGIIARTDFKYGGAQMNVAISSRRGKSRREKEKARDAGK